MIRSGQLALASFKAGLGVSANSSIGGFDTHGNHDTDQRRSVIQLLTGLAGVIDAIDRAHMTDKVYLIDLVRDYPLLGNELPLFG